MSQIAGPNRLAGWASLGTWPVRRWSAAALGAAATIAVIGLPTVLIPNPVFGRDVPPTWWAWPALAVTAVLAGLLGATYIRRPEDERTTAARAGLAGGFLSYLAVGCPVCNKIALLALGYTGALQWFAPIQPWLALAGTALLAYALHRRLTAEFACPIPGGPRR